MIDNKKSLKDRFIEIFGPQEKLEIDLRKIEKDLNVTLPDDFKEISTFYDGNNGFYIDGMYCYNIDSSPDNILTKTLFYREKQLPEKFIVLGEPQESVILMETPGDEVKSSRVLWLSYSDVENLCYEENLKDKPIIFSSFSNFFDYLLTEEEKI